MFNQIKYIALFISLPVALAVALPGSVFAGTKTETFDSAGSAASHGWVEINSRADGNNFGFSNTANAGGTAGEAGGLFKRHTAKSFYVDTALGLSLNQGSAFSASGKVNFKTPGTTSVSAYIAYANTNSTGSADAMGLIWSRNGSGTSFDLWAFYDNGVHTEGQFMTGVAPGQYTFGLSYDGANHLTVSITNTSGVRVGTTNVTTSGTMTFNCFGMVGRNLSSVGAQTGEVYMDDVTYTAEGGAPLTPTVQFATTASSGSESNSPALLSVVLSPAQTNAVTVDYAVTGGTATGGGVDYTLANGTLSFAAGETSKNVSIGIVNDGVPEGNETITLVLSNATGGVPLGAQTNHTFTIIDNSPLRLSITRGSGNNLLVSWPAQYAGYVLQWRPELVNPPPWAEVTNAVSVSNGLRQVVVSALGLGSFYRLGPPMAAVSVAFDQAAGSNLESVTPVNLGVSLSAASAQTVSVNYAVTGGTATGGGVDYTLANGMVTFNPGETSKSVALAIVDDGQVEGSETVVVGLSNPVNAVLGGTPTYTYTILDNDTPPPGGGQVLMQVDVGSGPVQAGWFSAPACGTFNNVSGSGIDVTLATGSAAACASRNPVGSSGPLANVEADLLFADDQATSPNADFVLTFANLTPGLTYRLLSYHHRTDEADTTIPGVTVSGAAAVISQPATILQSHAIMDTPAEIIFTAGADPVVVRYLAPVGGCVGCQAFLNGFVLEAASSSGVQFKTVASGVVEAVSPALLEVTLTPVQANMVTVDYAVTGGTAAGGGVDYTLATGTLTFNPGETNKGILIPIVNDGLNEEDETIVVSLSNPTGGANLGYNTTHTYTILDPRSRVAFQVAASGDLENVSPASIPVVLSVTNAQTVTVNYAVTGGTATGEGVDYTLANGTLTFSPGVGTQYVTLTVVDDLVAESAETVVITLSNPVNALLGNISQFTYTIRDNEAGIYWDGLTWLYTTWPTTRLFVNGQNQLEWTPEKGEYITVRLPDMPLGQVGQKAEVSYLLMTDGSTNCANCTGCPYCGDSSIKCMAGTSDFRVGLRQAGGDGYGWRFGPNMTQSGTRYVDCTGEVHKSGQFQDGNDLSSNNNLTDPIPGFALPPGQFSTFKVSLERTGGSSIRQSITLNGRTYTHTSSGGPNPSVINEMAILMRNGRPFSRWVLAKP